MTPGGDHLWAMHHDRAYLYCASAEAYVPHLFSDTDAGLDVNCCADAHNAAAPEIVLWLLALGYGWCFVTCGPWAI